ncbi:MAG: DUF4743 domain-containing protein [Candidatus Levyibacteriota bacterium]
MEAGILTAIDARLRTALAPDACTGHVLRVDGRAVGVVDAARAGRLAAFADVFRVGDAGIEFAPRLDDACTRSAAIAEVARELAREGRLSAWRDELFAVSEEFGAPPAFVVERAAARYFGIRTWAVHVNGVVRDADGASMWFARRSEDKPIDPGMLDNLVGGGIAAGHGVGETVVREAWEEAGIPAALASRASCTGTVDVCRTNPDGLQRETIFVHDLWLPPDFVPANQDGEAVEHRRVGLPEAARLLAIASGRDQVTVDATLVALDFLLRHDALPGDPASLAALRSRLRPG